MWKGILMKKKKARKMAKKLMRYCHRTPCSECGLHKDHCLLSGYPAPAYWPIGPKETMHLQISRLMEDGNSIEQTALILKTSEKKVKRHLMDIRKANAGIRMLEEEK